jgi:hypothetical protein
MATALIYAMLWQARIQRLGHSRSRSTQAEASTNTIARFRPAYLRSRSQPLIFNQNLCRRQQNLANATTSVRCLSPRPLISHTGWQKHAETLLLVEGRSSALARYYLLVDIRGKDELSHGMHKRLDEQTRNSVFSPRTSQDGVHTPPLPHALSDPNHCSREDTGRITVWKTHSPAILCHHNSPALPSCVTTLSCPAVSRSGRTTSALARGEYRSYERNLSHGKRGVSIVGRHGRRK